MAPSDTPKPAGWIKDSERFIHKKVMNLFKKANNIGISMKQEVLSSLIFRLLFFRIFFA